MAKAFSFCPYAVGSFTCCDVVKNVVVVFGELVVACHFHIGDDPWSEMSLDSGDSVNVIFRVDHEEESGSSVALSKDVNEELAELEVVSFGFVVFDVSKFLSELLDEFVVP